jgi:hypoxanthine phosphoribosyltransferase
MKEFYSFEEFQKDIKSLTDEIKKYNPDCLVAIARGGLTSVSYTHLTLPTIA